MTQTESRDFNCDLCGGDDAAEIEVARLYNGDEPIHVCRTCGFVYVRRRRTADIIARDWSETIYGPGYTAHIPAVKARQTYVADTINVELGLAGKRLCDIGSGEGQFVEIVRGYGATVFAVEPSPANCRLLAAQGIAHFQGTVEAFRDSPAAWPEAGFDLVSIIWTLENCQSCRSMLDVAWTILKPGGHLVVATGSRLLVPFKKPLGDYFSPIRADDHAVRFSANTLGGIMAVSGFEPVFVNRYLDSDVLLRIGRKTDRKRPIAWSGDDYRAVLNFFDRWHTETHLYYPAAGVP